MSQEWARSNYNNYKLLSDIWVIKNVDFIYFSCLPESTNFIDKSEQEYSEYWGLHNISSGGNKQNNTKPTHIMYIAPFFTSSISQLREENWWLDFLMREIKHLLQQPVLVV